MCGIFGVIAGQELDLERTLASAIESLGHRGPDDRGSEILDGPAGSGLRLGLAATRLAILDLSPAGHQPMVDPDTGCRLVYNGEISNFRDLRRELEGHGIRFNSKGDTEVLLKVYSRWGRECPGKLRGMFAFAVWDPRTASLMIARDRLGVKPLYFVASLKLFAFSSEVSALVRSGLVDRRLDHRGLASYLAFGAVQSPWTIIQGVRELPPGKSLIWMKGETKEVRYWNLASTASSAPATADPAVASERVREILGDAVARALVSDVPTALFLSGGMDSSAIALLASRALAERVRTFSVGFKERAYSEAPYADEIARLCRTDHTPVELSSEELFDALPGALAAHDQPSIDGLNSFIVCRAAKRAGMTVGLSGLGGDELFGGYRSFRTIPKMLWLEKLRKGRGVGRERHAPNSPLPFGWPAKLRAWASSDVPGAHPYFLSRLLFVPSAVRALMTDEAAWEEFREEFPRTLPGVEPLDTVNQVSVLEAATYMTSMLLRDTDAMSMANSLEVRVPFTDHILWEYVLPLDGAMKVSGHLRKPLLARALGSLLPEKFAQRPKMGFTLPMDLWLRTGPLREEVERELHGEAWQCLLPLEPATAREVWTAFLEGRTTWSRPWSLYALIKWAERTLGRTR